MLAFLYVMFALFAISCGMIHSDNRKSDEENQILVGQLEEKYGQLEAAQSEIKNNFDRLKETNIKLEEANKRLAASVAEFFTLQQISKAISSIFNIKELLKYVNDIIIGVMGVSNSTILFHDEKAGGFKLYTTNISPENDLVETNDSANCELFMKVFETKTPLIDNYVNSDRYNFTRNRGVKSLICVPLIIKSRVFGLVIVEHKYHNAFDDDNVRLLDIIGQQVGIAMENAELYQKMQDMATVDYLTGIFNRQYFQEKLAKEFENARRGNYQLCLAIYDIDHFKKFNDTFGHLFGDKVLKSIADTVKNSLNKGDVFARFGGEEFIILFPRTSLKEACERVEKLRQEIAGMSIMDNLVSASVTVSFGVSCYPECAVTQNELLRTADDALYYAKESGRNCMIASKQLS